MIQALIIDVDDTLCLTEVACFAMENETLINMGRDPMSREVHLSTWGQPLFDAIKKRSPGIDADAFTRAFEPVIAEYIRDGKLDTIPDANYEALDKLIAMGKQLMVLTSRTHGELKHLLEPDHLLASRIQAFYYKDNTQFHKPDPRVFDELLAENGLLAENCAYIGDSPSDAAAAKQAGLHFIASLESGIRTEQSFDTYNVDRFTVRFPDVVDAINEIDAALHPDE